MENTALPIPEDLVGALSVIVKTLPMEMEIVKNTCLPDIDGAKFQTLQWDLEDWKEYLENAIITQYKKVPILRLDNKKSSEH